ncbi:uncharacterized protein LOC127533437 [Acanthochromis polyacanthus]|uniref:uncharacterized protein LOC127533437 n=1 Tax=Acanthochromis polyacanthus TaxID=80966 RepID=UPI00223457A6|nr:uncharacterized protein LOC127533437 [Acanthochromis polyacanthus]
MPTQKDCTTCKKSIGVASKTCQHCGGKQPYKVRLESQKEKLASEGWRERQKTNSSINKVYDATNLLLHKWNLLDRHPVLFLAKKNAAGFVAECLCPRQMDTEEVKDAFDTMKGIYGGLLNVTVAAQTSEVPASVSTSPAPPVSTSPAPPVSMSTSPAPPVSTSPAPPMSMSTSLVPPVSTSLASPVATSKQKRKSRNADPSECPVHQGSSVFPYKKILKKRLREGRVEVLVQWQPCSGCGAKWKNSWELQDNVEL